MRRLTPSNASGKSTQTNRSAWCHPAFYPFSGWYHAPPNIREANGLSEGIRIRHNTLRGPLTVAVRDLTERIRNPHGLPWPGCSVCALPSPGHEGYKTRHVQIDHDGYGLVSQGVWEGLCHLVDRGGFELMNTISNPPRLIVALGSDGGVTTTVQHKMPVPIVPGGN